MYNWKTVVGTPLGGRLSCSNGALGDPWAGHQKQCYCEKKVHVKPIFIA